MKLLLPFLLFLLSVASLRAELSAPDNILYGTIALNGVPVLGYFQLIITRSAAQKIVSFFAVSTGGVPGYEGATRHYAIEATANLTTGPWVPVPGYSNIIGNNATIAYPTQEPDPAFYYRSIVWLTRP